LSCLRPEPKTVPKAYQIAPNIPVLPVADVI
jgi:hypothetical protein